MSLIFWLIVGVYDIIKRKDLLSLSCYCSYFGHDSSINILLLSRKYLKIRNFITGQFRRPWLNMISDFLPLTCYWSYFGNRFSIYFCVVPCLPERRSFNCKKLIIILQGKNITKNLTTSVRWNKTHLWTSKKNQV